jgi:hypothetical protein
VQISGSTVRLLPHPQFWPGIWIVAAITRAENIPLIRQAAQFREVVTPTLTGTLGALSRQLLSNDQRCCGALDDENANLKKLLAEAVLDNAMTLPR